jgi:hypothetical protein
MFIEQEHKGHNEPRRTRRDLNFRRVRRGSLCPLCSCTHT